MNIFPFEIFLYYDTFGPHWSREFILLLVLLLFFVASADAAFCGRFGSGLPPEVQYDLLLEQKPLSIVDVVDVQYTCIFHQLFHDPSVFTPLIAGESMDFFR